MKSIQKEHSSYQKQNFKNGYEFSSHLHHRNLIRLRIRPSENVVLRVRDEAIHRDICVHEYRAHDSMMLSEPVPWLTRLVAAQIVPRIDFSGDGKIAGVGVDQPLARASLLVPLDAEARPLWRT